MSLYEQEMDHLPRDMWLCILGFVNLRDLAHLHPVCKEMEAMARGHRKIILAQDLTTLYRDMLSHQYQKKIARIVCLVGCFTVNPRCHHHHLYARYGRFIEDIREHQWVAQKSDIHDVLLTYGLPPPLASYQIS